MLYDPSRHESLGAPAWDEERARSAIERVVRDTEAHFSEDAYWPAHPLDLDGAAPRAQGETALYHGACGVLWALHYLQATGAATLTRAYLDDPVRLDRLRERNRAWLGAEAERERASFLMGDTPIEMLAYGATGDPARAATLAMLIEGNIDHPARELMWGAPGTLLAALFLFEHTADARWAALFRATAGRLRSRLEWSDAHQCAYWTQDLYGQRSTYLDAVHGFVATALPLIRGRHLLEPGAWDDWLPCIVNTMRRTVDLEDGKANWRPFLTGPRPTKQLVQYCHGAPGFVVCLAGLPCADLDDVLLAAGELTWTAGPLAKGSNLCHGTGGNGYALLKLYDRTRDTMWLERARAFAMHGIAQTEDHARRYGIGRYSLWTGDPGFAIYLWDCVRATGRFPTLDVFYATGKEG